jgi:DNA-binding CsgD family transcriptional regulator
LALEMVALLSETGRPGEALTVGDAAVPAARGGEHAELCLRLARAAVSCARWRDADAYVARAGRPEDPRSLILAADAAFGAGEASRSESLAMAAVVRAEQAGTPAMLCEALDVVGRVQRLHDPLTAKATFARAAQVAAEHGLTAHRVAALVSVGTVELLEAETSASLVRARELASEAGLLGLSSSAEVMLLEHLILERGPRAAQAAGRDLMDRGRRLKLPEVQGAGALAVALAAAVDDDPSGLASALAGMPHEVGLAEVEALGPAIRALPRLLAHDLAGASALLDAGLTPLVEHRVAAPLHQFGLWALLRTVTADRDDEARSAVRRLPAARRPANRGALRYADAVAAAREGRSAAAATLVSQGDADLAALPWLHRLLRLLVLESEVTERWGDPVPALRQDLLEHEQAGDSQLARICRDLLRRAGAPAPRSGRGTTPVPQALRAKGVTSREMDVLVLTWDGLTNAEIAARLYLSPRTVETHVAHLLVKLGVTDRRQLRASSSELSR